jgi:cation-transporting ATPase E
VDRALAAVAWSDPNPNATQLALQEHYPDAPDGWELTGSVPFSSARKWSASTFGEHGSWVLGATEMILGDAPADLTERVRVQSARGRRVLLLARSPDDLHDESLPSELTAAALVMIEDRIRGDAAETLAYFAEQDVELKVISGDNPVTVGAVATRAGLADADNVVDARSLPSDPDQLANAVEATTVFGRVTPHQKRAMVGALQSRGHVVAMTGDGVNDVLALKDADVGIAMASGSEATRAVAQLVLLDSNFSGLPQVVAEGRRVINNIERVAAVFLNKTTYAILLAWVVAISGIEYPFLPRHLTLIGSATIGIPGFFLALAPNTDRVTGNFFRKVGLVAVPSGVICTMATMAAYIYARGLDDIPLTEERTAATLALTGVALLVLARASRPFVPWKIALIASMAGLVLAAIVTPLGRDYFELDLPPQRVMWVLAGIVAIAGWLLALVAALIRRYDLED